MTSAQDPLYAPISISDDSNHPISLVVRGDFEKDTSHLEARCARLSDEYMDGVRPTSINWSKRLRVSFGICYGETKRIAISDQLRDGRIPEWVLDPLIVHELAHLIEPNHGPAFWELANRHPRQRDVAVYQEGCT